MRWSGYANYYIPCRLFITSIFRCPAVIVGAEHRTHELDQIHVSLVDVHPLVMVRCELGA
jgi:hypothetical protein